MNPQRELEDHSGPWAAVRSKGEDSTGSNEQRRGGSPIGGSKVGLKGGKGTPIKNKKKRGREKRDVQASAIHRTMSAGG